MDADSSAQSLSLASRDEEKEQILHSCHRHRLKLLLPFESDGRYCCDICNMALPQEGIWGCAEDDECRFNIHKSCLDSLPETVQFQHIDDLILCPVVDDDDDKKCTECSYRTPRWAAFRTRDNATYRKYVCIKCCMYYKLIDDDPLSLVYQFPRGMYHFFHPCFLELTFSASTTCNACFLNHHYLSYGCYDCKFFLDLECARIPEDNHVDNPNQIHHFCHFHPLHFFPGGEILCKLCESSSSTTSNNFYGCTKCQFYAHISCIDVLPRKTIHPSLDQTIVLLTAPSYVCATCDRACSGLTFYSGRHNYCVKCILWPMNEFDGYGGFESIHHQHELTIREVNEARCFMCGRDCSGRNYECSKCSTYFHKSCAELPRELQHPIHPQHLLTLTALDTVEVVKCKLCFGTLGEGSRYSRFYRCESRCFSLDSHCASLSCLSSIQYQGHPHLLDVVENLSYENACCNKCSETLPRDFPVLRCVECQFSLHLLCGPLPCIIKDHRHVHPLTLTEYYVEDNLSDKFACHICEKKRNPRLRVYICTEGCIMSCDVECVLAEVVASLRGERGVLELDTVYPKVACKMITRDSNWKEMITCGSCAENDENVATDVPVFSLKELIESAEPGFESELLEERNNKLKSGVADLRGDDPSQSDYDGRKYHYSRKAFKQFIKNIEESQGMDFGWDKFENIFSHLEGLRIGGDYLLPNTLDSVYNHFFGKHTLFGPDCKLNHDQKRLIVFYICSILHDMRMTKVVDVTAERIALWSSALKAVRAMDRYNGLELNFLFKHVTRIAEDHYMVQAVDIIEDTFSKLCEKKEDLSEREKRLIRELAETRNDIEDNKEELRSFRAYRAAGASETKKEYYASLENKWRPCYEC